MRFYVIDLDKYEPEQWAGNNQWFDGLTSDSLAEHVAEMWAENSDPERTYHVGVATTPDGSDLCEHIVKSRLKRVFEAKSVKRIGSMVPQ